MRKKRNKIREVENMKDKSKQKGKKKRERIIKAAILRIL